MPRASNATKFLYSLAHNVKPIIAAVDGVAIGIGTTMLFHCDYVLASTTATFSTPFIHLGLVPEGASSLLMPRTMGHQRAFATLVMGRTVSADDARDAGFVNAVVAPGHTEAEARKVAREICALPAEAVAISRKLLRPPPEDLTRRIDQEGHLFGERMRSKEAVAAFKAFFCSRKKDELLPLVGALLPACSRPLTRLCILRRRALGPRIGSAKMPNDANERYRLSRAS